MLGRIASNIELRRNIMFETTLASRSFARSIPHWQSFGYEITLYYLLLPTAEMAMERVKQRVATGGHDIPEIVIRRRFARSLANLEKTYKHLVDSWYIYSGETQKLIASGRR